MATSSYTLIITVYYYFFELSLLIKEHHPLWGNLSLSEIILFWLIVNFFIVMVAVLGACEFVA